jgi:16S rRNA C1402 N4-methylase RsmH
MKKSIRVIKRDERAQQKIAEEHEINKQEPEQETARDMVATVSSWVNEFKQKRREETTRAFKSLFRDQTPQPTGMGS